MSDERAAHLAKQWGFIDGGRRPPAPAATVPVPDTVAVDNALGAAGRHIRNDREWLMLALECCDQGSGPRGLSALDRERIEKILTPYVRKEVDR